MILENYNGQLKENIESPVSFIVNELPILAVRPFDPRIIQGQRFILPYFVDNSLNTSYEENILTNTFTVIVALDEDTKPESSVFRVKQTTYAGEQLINLGVISELGEHTLSIKAIQSNGIASDTKFFKFYVDKADADKTIADLTEVDSFTASEENVVEEGQVPFWFNLPTTYQEYSLYSDNSRHNIVTPTGSISRTIDYSVEIVKSNNVVIGYNVSVVGSITYPKVTVNGTSKGPWTIELNGTYYIKNTCELNGSTVQLSDYLNTRSVPSAVTIAAARNKIGITFLLRACKAYCDEHNYDGVKLPRYDYIVTYANLKGNTLESTRGNGRNSRNDIEFPKNLVIDFNYSSIKALQTSVKSGKLVVVYCGYRLELKNLSVVGDYNNFALANSNDGESKNCVQLFKCRFCILNNVQISYSCGYELTGGNGIPTEYSRKGYPFDTYGYIDYNGVFNAVEPIKTDLVNKDVTLDEDGFPVDTTILDVGRNRNGEQAVSEGVSNVMCTSQMYDVGNITTSAYNRAFQIGIYDSIQGLWNEGGRNRTDGSAIFVSFYDSNSKFVKTIKVKLWEIAYVPYGAKYYKLTAIGCLAIGTITSLNRYDAKGDVQAQLAVMSHKYWLMANRVIDCIVHDTRTCIVTPCGNQSYVKGLTTYNVSAQGNSKAYLTSHLCDIEDMADNHYHLWFTNWHNLYGIRGGLHVLRGNDLCCDACYNVTIEHLNEVKEGLISNCLCSIILDYTANRIIKKNAQFRNNFFTNVKIKQMSTTHRIRYYFKHCFIGKINNENGDDNSQYVINIDGN